MVKGNLATKKAPSEMGQENRVLTFLHLSDIHFRHRAGSSTQFDLEAQLRKPLLDDIISKPANGAPYDGLFITGDIAFSGKKEEYDKARNWLEEIYSKTGLLPERMDGAFQWLGADIANDFLPSQIWREAIAKSAAKTLNTEALCPQKLALCAWFVEPEVIRKTLSAERSDVVELTKAGLEALPQPLRKPTAFLFVTLGLRHDQLKAASLILRGYFEVYEALAKSSFPWESWILLDHELPTLESHWPQWDNCERLRRGVRDWLFKYCGSGQLLLDAAPDDRRSQIARDTLSLEEPREFLD